MKIFLKAITILILSTNATYATVYSLLIGISDYKYIPNEKDLRFCDDDVVLFYKFLKNDLKISESNIYILTNQQATYNNIVEAAKYVFKKASKDDLVIFYFSGHGDDGKVLAYDYDGSSNGITFSKIAELFRNCESENKIIFADACRIGGLKPKTNTTDNANSDKVIAMVSCRANELSGEHPYIKQGFFSYFLLEGLKGKADLDKDKKLTIKELHLYVKKNVAAVTENRQNPITFGNFSLNQVILSY